MRIRTIPVKRDCQVVLTYINPLLQGKNLWRSRDQFGEGGHGKQLGVGTVLTIKSHLTFVQAGNERKFKIKFVDAVKTDKYSQVNPSNPKKGDLSLISGVVSINLKSINLNLLT